MVTLSFPYPQGHPGKEGPPGTKGNQVSSSTALASPGGVSTQTWASKSLGSPRVFTWLSQSTPCNPLQTAIGHFPFSHPGAPSVTP